VSRLAVNRLDQLSREEIVQTAVRQFVLRASEPSIRSLATELRVTPTAIYHHFPSIAAVYQGAVELVWAESIVTSLELAPSPLTADPVDVLVAVGVATRRTWLEHFRLARYMAATPRENDFTRAAVPFLAGLFRRLGLDEADAAAAFYAYSSFMIGAVLFAAERKCANESLPLSPPSRTTTSRLSIENVMDVSEADPERDEQLFAGAIRRLVGSYTS
jgi:AcrR family transcriptional regulator